MALRRDRRFRVIYAPGLEAFRWRVGLWKAWYVFELARRRVPGYRAFLGPQLATRVPILGWTPDLSGVPITEKDNYVRQHTIEDRCLDGRLPEKGVMIDESSGTSGVPNNWVRGPDERWAVKKVLQVALRRRLGAAPFFVLNAFALGPWATGMNVSMSVVDIALLKSTGPDLSKIEATLKLFGPRYRYVIMGYPPFLKALADRPIPWKDFDITIIYGGEGMSEEMRDYLLRSFRRVYGSYGASDLEINVAGESDYSIALRRLLARHEGLRHRLLHTEYGSLPIIFQYNPLDYYVETNRNGELVVTIGRASNISPKVRYNIHDLGHVVRIPELKRILVEEGIPEGDLPALEVDFPLLFHYGRSDMSVAFYGSKITPQNLEAILYGFPDIAPLVAGFALLVSEDAKANKHLSIAVECAVGVDHAMPVFATLGDRVLARLSEVNQDYRESSKMIPPGLEPKVEVFGAGQGPFAGVDPRVKRRYILPGELQRTGPRQPERV